MRIVSDNSPEDLRRRAAERQLGFAVRALAVNMLRIMRGAGKPYRFAHELADCSKALREYLDAFEHNSPSDLIERVLNPEKSWPDGEDDSDRYHDAWRSNPREDEAIMLRKQNARRAMRLAALRITASMLAGQRLQTAHGEKDLREAISRHEQLTEELRDLRAKEWRGGRAAHNAANARVLAAALALATKRQNGRRKPALAEHPPSVPPRPKPVQDRLQPPSYEGLRVVALPPAIREEFGVASALDLALWLNRLRRERAIAPLPQGQFPSTRATLDYVVKELRKERAL
ncbi:hypothetical protein [Bosea sp. (in: a-proteobacteria)]|uniref:hypothetical protein n=1 Tax=Bosea sp. (in: a-proteobacteria) TaxID=1871050 RepID=UPI002B4A8832|nr:hypothetical protein [Bosea sp. (in: a-proteobacteria)]WRH60125.1 MAG: hypothetical protein RSE11_10275 [Bosea sp. (in: a-proteobacteria)]